MDVSRVSVDFGDLEFNRDSTMKVHTLDGWWTTPSRNALMSPAPVRGAVATGRWREREKYLTLAGHTIGHDVLDMRRRIIAAFPEGVDVPVVVTLGGVSEQMFVRSYDAFDIKLKGNQVRFVLPLVALDPLKYSATPLSGLMGAFAGGSLYLAYTADGSGGYYSTYPEPGPSQTYRDEEPTGAYPDLLTLVSTGDVTSRRLVIKVTGPLTAGDWWLVNEATDEALSVEQSLAAGQTLTLDSHEETADIGGSPVESLVAGDWLSLAPGSNTFRLMVGTRNDEAYAEVTAFEGMR
jgi:hypothetical protein